MARVPLGAPVTHKTNNSEKRSGLVPAGEGEGGAWVQRATPGPFHCALHLLPGLRGPGTLWSAMGMRGWQVPRAVSACVLGTKKGRPPPGAACSGGGIWRGQAGV